MTRSTLGEEMGLKVLHPSFSSMISPKIHGICSTLQLSNIVLLSTIPQLVLVGGVDPFYNGVSKRWWSLDEKHHWTERFPSMPIERFGASVVSDGKHLIVAGGDKGGVFGRLDVVDVYDGQEWRRVQSLPKTCSRMKSVVHEGFWYLAGGVGQDHKVFYTSLELLIASTHSTTVGDDPVWETLPDAPFQCSTPVIFGKQLTTIGGLYTSAIYVYLPIKRWYVWETCQLRLVLSAA